jgi:hypothetical protein
MTQFTQTFPNTEDTMAKRLGMRGLFCLTVLALASVTAFAGQDTRNGVVIINGGREAVAMRPQLPVRAGNPNPGKLKTIYSNLGTSTDAYYSGAGWTVCGPDSNICTQWVAGAFTPKANSTLTEIEVAVGWFAGTNAAILRLNKDSNGLPGKAIHSWNLTNLYDFGTCCTLDVLKDKKGIKVKGKTQYWVVASTTLTSTFGGAWNYTYNLATGSWANSNDQGTTWNSQGGDIPAFGVFGK